MGGSDVGIVLSESYKNIVSKNTVMNFGWSGLGIYASNDNTIYTNSFINNTHNARSSDSTNIWNSPEQVSYTYNGNSYTNYLGNYWSDYSGSDSNGDGIGELAYPIEADNDNYPLMQPFKNYGIGLPLSVGGIAEFPVGGSGSSSLSYAVIIGCAIVALAALALGVWFARRC